MKEQFKAERTDIIYQLKQSVKALIDLNRRTKIYMSSNKANIKKLKSDNKEMGKMKSKNSFFIRIFSLFFRS